MYVYMYTHMCIYTYIYVCVYVCVRVIDKDCQMYRMRDVTLMLPDIVFPYLMGLCVGVACPD